MSINQPKIDDPVILDIQKRMALLQQEAMDHALSQLPVYDAKLIGYGPEGKESIAEMSGDFRLDYVHEAASNLQMARSFLTEGLGPKEARETAARITRVLLVIDCGKKPEPEPQVDQPPPTPVSPDPAVA
jgi:hypothetical protein